jgi:hypothetical protein
VTADAADRGTPILPDSLSWRLEREPGETLSRGTGPSGGSRRPPPDGIGRGGRRSLFSRPGGGWKVRACLVRPSGLPRTSFATNHKKEDGSLRRPEFLIATTIYSAVGLAAVASGHSPQKFHRPVGGNPTPADSRSVPNCAVSDDRKDFQGSDLGRDHTGAPHLAGILRHWSIRIDLPENRSYVIDTGRTG